MRINMMESAKVMMSRSTIAMMAIAVMLMMILMMMSLTGKTMAMPLR